MKKKELVYREILQEAIEKNNRQLSQAELSRKLKISLSTVNNAMKPLLKIGSIHIENRCFKILEPRKIFYYWASLRNIDKDVVYKTRAEKPVKKIESEMPSNAVFTAYSGYKFKFNDVPADYSEVYVYADEETKKDIEKRFPPNKDFPNVFVLKGDKTGLTVAQLFVDLWNLKEWYAHDFLKALEEKINNILE